MLYKVGRLYLLVLYCGPFALRLFKANIYCEVEFINSFILKVIYFDIIISDLKESG